MFGLGYSAEQRLPVGNDVFQYDYRNEKWILRSDKIPWVDFAHTVVEIPEP